MQFIKNNRITVLLTVILILGAVIMAYPSVSNYYNTMVQRRAIGSYTQAVTSLDRDSYKELVDNAKAYNDSIARNGFRWTMTEDEREDYNKQLSITDDGAFGYIEIPKINEKLVIYHGINDEILEKGVGHMEETSLPIGGNTSHCVLSGHRGLPSAKLFSDLDKLVEGDIFILSILDMTLTYEVDQIRIINPMDFTKFELEEGKDYVTLVTCTPYGVNTHRLLVRGHRIENLSGDALVSPDAVIMDNMYVMPFIAVPLVIIIFIVLLVSSDKKARYNKLKRTLNIK